MKRTCLCCTECHGWIERNRIVYYRCKWYWNMHYWHTLIQGSELAFPVCSTVRWVGRIFILSLCFYIARQGKMLMGIGIWDAAGFSGPSLCSRWETNFTPGQKLQAFGCLRCGFTLVFFQLWQSIPVSGWLFQCGRCNCCIGFAFFCCFFPWGGKGMFSKEQVYVFINLKDSFVDCAL